MDPVFGEQEAEGNNLSIEISSIECLRRKKLLVLDLNGLLADIVFPPPCHSKPDTIIERKAIFTRPFYQEFLKFCFEKFDVAVWSSRTKKNVDSIVDYLFGDMKQKLIFCWDMSHCTDTGFKTPENMYKPIVFKDLRKIWLNYYPNLPWERGYYNMSNTLLLDDSPYKALLNYEQNSIFPNTFSYLNQNDNSLAVGGNLRRYLDGLANAENMVEYVEHHPFGREHINEHSEYWNFYVHVVLILLLYAPEKVYPSIELTSI
ncbi:ubiquitin-like domain-containing CTD phosphatase 1 [Trifolium pratense]|nr:ubiquitin-like domain-containing CTD phosphatase 1 [Trifolium pratense]